MILQLFRVILKTSYYRYFLQERSGRPQSGNDLLIRDMGGQADPGFGSCPQLGSRDVVEAVSAIEQCGVLSAQAGSRPRERQSERPKRAPKQERPRVSLPIPPPGAGSIPCPLQRQNKSSQIIPEIDICLRGSGAGPRPIPIMLESMPGPDRASVLCQKDMDAANRGARADVPHMRHRRARKPTRPLPHILKINSSGKLGVLPSPLWGGAGGGGRSKNPIHVHS